MPVSLGYDQLRHEQRYQNSEMHNYHFSVLSFEFRNEGQLLCPAGEREAAVKEREAARALSSMTAATSAWEAVL